MSDVTHDVRPSPGIEGVNGVAGLTGRQAKRDRPLDIRLLGGCFLAAPGPAEIRIASRKGRALIAYLAVAPRMQAGREQLAALLWDDSPETQARQSLRQCLIALRKDLGPHAAALLTTPEFVALDADAVSVDVIRLEKLIAAGSDQALALDRGPFLKDFNVGSEAFMAWVAGERERVERLVTRATEARIEYLEAAGEGRRAIGVAESLVARDPLREDWQRRLLRLYARHNCREVALAHANELVANLKRELGAEPEPATGALISDIFNNQLTPTGEAASPAMSGRDAESPAPRGAWRRHAPLLVGATALCAAVLAFGLRPAPAPAPSANPGAFEPLTVKVRPPRLWTSAGAPERAFADQLATHLADRLSQFSDLRVVPNRPRSNETAEYSVEPELQQSNGAIRIVARLSDDTTGRWTLIDQIDDVHPTDDPEQFARRFSRQIDNKMYALEVQKPDDQMHEPLLTKARAAIDRGVGPQNDAEARAYFEEALRRNPDSTRAMVGIVKIMMEDTFFYVDGHIDFDRIERLLRTAVEKEPNAEYVHYWIGNFEGRKGETELALKSFQRVIELNPGFSSAYAQRGFMLMLLGHPQEAIKDIDYAIWLSPSDPYMGVYLTLRARVELNLGNDEAAIDILQKTLTRLGAAPRTYGLLAAGYAFLGDDRTAADFAAKFLRLSSPGSDESLLRDFRGPRFQQNPELVRRLQDALDEGRGQNIGGLVASPSSLSR